MQKIQLACIALLFAAAAGAQPFKRQADETPTDFIKRIFNHETLAHPVIESGEWDADNKAIICFINFTGNQNRGVIGYLFTKDPTGSYEKRLVDTFYVSGGASDVRIGSVFFVTADKDKEKELAIITRSTAHSPRYADRSLDGYFYDTFIYDNPLPEEKRQRLILFKKLSDKFSSDGFEGKSYDAESGRLVETSVAKHKNALSVRKALKRMGY